MADDKPIRRKKSFQVLTGRRFGRLVVLGEVPGRPGRGCRWVCRCDCGAKVGPFVSHALTRGWRTSCGCGDKEELLWYFWSRVRKVGACWEWQGTFDPKGYGLASILRRKHVFAHRLSFEMNVGDPGRLCVLHRCDNPACVHPGHLFLGTRRENNEDRDRKGRAACGEGHWYAKMTKSEVRRMRELAAQGVAGDVLATMFNLARSATYAIIRGESWKHVS